MKPGLEHVGGKGKLVSLLATLVPLLAGGVRLRRWIKRASALAGLAGLVVALLRRRHKDGDDVAAAEPAAAEAKPD